MTIEELKASLAGALFAIETAKHTDTLVRLLMEIDDLQQRINDLTVTGLSI